MIASPREKKPGRHNLPTQEGGKKEEKLIIHFTTMRQEISHVQ
jgi:hypothetical protein